VSGKFKEVGRDANVNISVYDKSSSNWISVSGTSSVSNDRERIRELWSPMIAGWFGEIDEKRNGTAEDPRISLIVVSTVIQCNALCILQYTFRLNQARFAIGIDTGVLPSTST